MSVLTLPDNIDFVLWATIITLDFPKLESDIPDDVSEWRDWANKLIYFNKLVGIPIADKDLYPTNESWKDWARQFINSYNPNN